jgi:hypothetical protein
MAVDPQDSVDVIVTIDGKALTEYTRSTTYNRSVDTYDVTGYGKTSKVFTAGLKDGTITLEGFYDATASTGSRVVLQPLFDARAEVVFVYKPEGTGTGKPQNSCSVVVKAYNESAPVADLIQWTAELQVSGSVTTTLQS